MENIARSINILGTFCGRRDLPALTRENLRRAYAMEQADIMVLFGGSILAGGDVLAAAMEQNVAAKYVIVGGEGHTTQSLRDRVHALYPDVYTTGMPEAEVFSVYLHRKYGRKADFLECKSTNCGNNITYLLELLRENNISHESIILTQDASMQRRMDAGLRKYADVRIINFAAYAAEVTVRDGELAFKEEICGMWDMERYISLLLGEIPRLRDDAHGYGPCGKGFIAHVDIPDAVCSAFHLLREVYPHLVRQANPAYASK